MGEVVDDAIIDVENIVRRLRQNRAAARPLSPFRVVLAASLEVRSAVVYASLIVILVFIPVFFLEGLAGLVLPPAGAGLRAGDRGVAPGGPDGDARAVADAPDRGDRAAARVAPGARAQDDLPRDLAGDRAAARLGDRRARGRLRRHRLGRRRAGRGVHARLPGERLPDALDREAGHVARGDAPDHRERQQGAAGRAGRAATSARTSAAPRSPTRSTGRTSPSSGSASTPRPTTTRRWPRCRRWSTATPGCSTTC